MKRLVKASSILGICLLLFSPVSLRAQDACAVILSDGVFDLVHNISSSYSSSQFHQAMCNGVVQASSSGGSNGLGVSVVVPGIDIPLGLSFSDAQQFQNYYKQSFCSTTSSAFVSGDAANFLTKIANPNILNAYNQCVRLRNRGLQASISTSPDQSVVRFQLSFSAPGEGSPLPVVRSVRVLPKENASCTGSVSPNLKIDANTYTLSCTRPGGAAVSIEIDTSYGLVSRDLLKEPNPPTKTDELMAAFPAGTVLAWYSKNGAIPNGWAICNGQNGTPDLRNKFIRGTGDFAEIGSMGGVDKLSATVSLPEAPWKGSDTLWGNTPWRNGPNPIQGSQQLPVIFQGDTKPPYLAMVYIIKM